MEFIEMRIVEFQKWMIGLLVRLRTVDADDSSLPLVMFDNIYVY